MANTLLVLCIVFQLLCTIVHSGDSKCSSDQKTFEEIINKGKALDVFYFMNDTKETIQLTWAGENSGVLILVTMTEGEAGPGLTSDIYRRYTDCYLIHLESDTNGKVFVKITHDLGEKVYIKRENGLQRHQNQKDSEELFVICYDVENKTRSILFVTEDGGSTWDKSSVPFVLSGQLRFYPRKRLSRWILTLEEKTSKLFLSLDNGKTWRMIHKDVTDFFWSIYDMDPEETIYVLHKPGAVKNDTSNQTLLKTMDFGQSWIRIMTNVVRVWAPRGIRTETFTDKTASIQTTTTTTTTDAAEATKMHPNSNKAGRFLYMAHHEGGDNQSTKLSVSLDGGESFHPVFLPTVQPERFFSVLEVEDDLSFVHLDAPNDTGHGTLFTSDYTGQIFTESLRQHLYPNHAPVTDFYKVASMRGTYMATRLNPDRTLHTVITHNRGASWRALGAPVNVEGGCSTDATTDTTDQQSTPVSSTKFSRHSNGSSSNSNPNTDGNQNRGNIHSGDTALLDGGGSGGGGGGGGGIHDDSLSVDPSATRICGLQISSQFSIRNRVIASSPLSISAAPGLILAHGHVATHLKNTPADVFVSSDGGYTWRKALEGPHHYQIANRGGLLVAVPANTLWPDVLRFSTDEGNCWHTIPLRSGIFKPTTSISTTTNSQQSSPIATVTVHEESTRPPPPPSVLTQSVLQLHSHATLTPDLEAPNVTSTAAESSLSRSKRADNQTVSIGMDETVVFTGLVTEPGGRAMAAAVYGYGTVSQRWRVAVVDFITNGMVTRTCVPEDYEIWTPHTALDGSQDGCLLGVKQYYRRLKKDSLCINEYGMDPLLQTETCSCTQADFECEYGYHRQIGSLDCIRNIHIEPINPCLLSPEQRQSVHMLGYRRIPGNRCAGGWQPPLLDQEIVRQTLMCPDAMENMGTRRSPSTFALSLIIIAVLLIAILGFICYRKSTRRPMRYSTESPSANFSVAFSRVRSAFSPWYWKRSNAGVLHFENEDQGQSWPPYSTNAASHQFQTTTRANGMSKENGNRFSSSHESDSKDDRAGESHPVSGIFSGKDTLSHLSNMRPSFMSRFHSKSSDVANLLESEEIAYPVESSEQPRVVDPRMIGYYDPLANPTDPTFKTDNLGNPGGFRKL